MHSCGSISQTNFRTVFGIARWCSTLSQESSQSTTQGSITTEEPFTLVKSDFTNFFGDIKKVLRVGLYLIRFSTLGPAYNELGYNEHSAITSIFFPEKKSLLIDISVKKGPVITSTSNNSKFS